MNLLLAVEGRSSLLLTDKELRVVLCLKVLWKVRLASNETRCLAEEKSKQNIGNSLVLVDCGNEMLEEMNDIKMGSFTKVQLKGWRNLSP